MNPAAETPDTPAGRGLAWSWPGAGFGTMLALPAAVVIPLQTTAGLALAVGMLPAAVLGLVQPRRARVRILLVGVVSGLCLLAGSVLAQVPALAVAAVFALAVLTSLAAARSRLGALTLMLCLPLTGIGLSFDDLATAAAGSGLIAAGSVYACGAALLWPDRSPAPQPPTPARAAGMLSYGIRLGLAGATAAGFGFTLGLEHVGWACGAALLVMRPTRDVLLTRAAGRAGSVTLGALTAAALGAASPGPIVLAAAVLVALVAATATRASRWYITPAFTTFLVFLLLLAPHPEDAGSRFVERTLETLLGVGLALFFGVAVPWFGQRGRHAPVNAVHRPGQHSRPDG